MAPAETGGHDKKKGLPGVWQAFPGREPTRLSNTGKAASVVAATLQRAPHTMSERPSQAPTKPAGGVLDRLYGHSQGSRRYAMQLACNAYGKGCALRRAMGIVDHPECGANGGLHTCPSCLSGDV